MRRVRALAAAATGAVMIAAPGSASMAQSAWAVPVTSVVTERVTAREVAASNEKVGMAYADLSNWWGATFEEVGARFARPGLARYRSAIRTACGPMSPQNAFYCSRDNTIYYDDVFVAAQAKSAARELGTDGDMAAVGVIAHEMGHAVAMQLGYDSPVSYDNESLADCLAGAFARHAAESGALEAGDLDEAFHGMSTAADPRPQLTGDRRVDRRILAQVAQMGHGTRDQRMGNFRAGYEGGAGTCLPEFR